MTKQNHNQKGFTLVELLIVIAIIAVLASVVFVALDPLKRFQDARDSSRWSDITALLGAIKVDQIDNGGSYLSNIQAIPLVDEFDNPLPEEVYAITKELPYTPYDLCDRPCSQTITSQAHCIDLSELVNEGYIGELPVSPNGQSTWDDPMTGYYLIKRTNGAITIGACEAEGGEPITVTR